MRPSQWPLEATEGVEPRETLGVPGAILKAIVDPSHFLTIGYSGEAPVLVQSNLAFDPAVEIASPVRFVDEDRLRPAGFAYDGSLARLAETPYLVDERIGSGHVVLFLDDPGFRVYWHGLARLLLNSVLLSPSF